MGISVCQRRDRLEEWLAMRSLDGVPGGCGDVVVWFWVDGRITVSHCVFGFG